MKKLNIIFLILILPMALSGKDPQSKSEIAFSEVRTKLLNMEGWPTDLKIGDKKLTVHYTINKEFQDYLEGLVKRYRPDFSSMVVIENGTGKILATVGYERKKNKIRKDLPFTIGHPSASIIKVVTSAELIESTEVSPQTNFNYVGRGSTLYKYQLKKRLRPGRRVSLMKAFAFSNNVVFAKAAINNLTGIGVFNMAEKFGFNKKLIDSEAVGVSSFEMPENTYEFAELASGFNRRTTMSPLHGAVIASIIGNEGEFIYPYLIESIEMPSEKPYVHQVEKFRSIKDETSKELEQMMKLTVSKGTAKRSFRGMKSSLKKRLEFGGKTGSITGGVPFGKRDWFIAFANEKENKNSGISLAVMNINGRKWYVKSAFLARKAIEYYFEKIKGPASKGLYGPRLSEVKRK